MTTYLLEAERPPPLFVGVAEVPLLLALPLHVGRCLQHVALWRGTPPPGHSSDSTLTGFTPLTLLLFTWSGTVALLVCRWARVSRSTRMRTPLESITSFTFFCRDKTSIIAPVRDGRRDSFIGPARGFSIILNYGEITTEEGEFNYPAVIFNILPCSG